MQKSISSELSTSSGRRSRAELRPYQLRAIERLKRDNAFFIAPVGSGKTATLLTTISDLLAERVVKRVLVSAPLRVAAHVWPNEPAKWEHLHRLRVASIAGLTPKKRLAILNDKTIKVVCVNPELIPKLCDDFHNGVTYDFDCLIVDESRGYQDAGSQRFKKLRHHLDKFTRRYTTTATPGNLRTIWTQVHIADLGNALGRSYFRYEQEHFHSPNPYSYEVIPNPGTEELVQKRIAYIACRVDESELVALPPVSTIVHEVEMSDGVDEMYQQLVEQFFIELGDEPVTAANAAVLSGKLRQLTQGALYLPDGGHEVVHTEKLEELAELVSELDGEPLVVAYQYRFELEALRERFPQARFFDGLNEKETDALLKDFAAGKVPLLCGHPGQFGHGIDGLQLGCRRMAFLGLPWSHDAYVQTVGRLNRSGQTKPVFIHLLHTPGSIDDDVRAAVEDKAATESAMIAAIKKLR